MDTSALITIQQIVQSYMNEKNDYSLENYERYAQIVIEGISDLHIYHFYKMNPWIGTVNDIGILKVPPDFIDYLAIGRVVNGEIEPLALNKDIAIPVTSECGIDVPYSNLPASMDYPYWLDYTKGGGYSYGEYRYDKERRQFVFLHTQMRGQEVYLEYASTGISVTEETFIDRALLPVAKEYLNHVLVERSNAVPQEKQYALFRFGEKLKRYHRKRYKFTATEILDAIRRGYTTGPKR